MRSLEDFSSPYFCLKLPYKLYVLSRLASCLAVDRECILFPRAASFYVVIGDRGSTVIDACFSLNKAETQSVMTTLKLEILKIFFPYCVNNRLRCLVLLHRQVDDSDGCPRYLYRRMWLGFRLRCSGLLRQLWRSDQAHQAHRCGSFCLSILQDLCHVHHLLGRAVSR